MATACIDFGGTKTGGGGWTAETPMVLPSYIDDVEISKTTPWCKAGYLEIISICRPFPIRIKSYLQEFWPMVESALKESDMTCELNLNENVVIFSTYKVPDLDNLLKAKELFQLLELNVPACQAITILKKDGLYPEFGMNREQYVEQHNKLLPSKVDQMETDEIILIDRRVPKCIESKIQEVVRMVRNALEQNGISCSLRLMLNYNQHHSFLRFSTTMTEVTNDSIVVVRELLLLLGMQVPADKALRVLNAREWTVIWTGDLKGGLCSDFGITREQYVERKRLVLRSLKALKQVTGCEIHVTDFFVIAIGPLQGLKLVKKIVEDCIVHNVAPAPRIRSVTRTSTMKKLGALRLCEP